MLGWVMAGLPGGSGTMCPVAHQGGAAGSSLAECLQIGRMTPLAVSELTRHQDHKARRRQARKPGAPTATATATPPHTLAAAGAAVFDSDGKCVMPQVTALARCD